MTRNKSLRGYQDVGEVNDKNVVMQGLPKIEF